MSESSRDETLLAPGDAGGPLGLYVHVPFCVRKCLYCDFVSFPLDRTPRDHVTAYLGGLRQEIAWYEPYWQERGLASIYVGGGTPTALDSTALRTLLNLLRPAESLLGPESEFTVEVNPGTIDPDKLAALRDVGVNRLSLGVQAFDDAILRRLGRVHTARDALTGVEMARAAGFYNLSLDLMFSLPGQTMAGVRASLDAAIGLSPEHISAYSLIVEEGTPFATMREQGTLALPTEDEELGMYQEVRETLARAGYAHYEISNFARPGYEAKHNVLYWQNREYVGVGPAAAGYLCGDRYTNTTSIQEYHRSLSGGSPASPRTVSAAARRAVSPAAATLESISERESRAESMFLGLRLLAGVSRTRFASRHGVSLDSVYGPDIQRLADTGLVETQGDAVRLSPAGLPVANQVFAAFV